MSYSVVADYRDELLKEFVDDGYIADIDADIVDLAKSMGVLPLQIPSPCPNIIKKLSIAMVYTAVAADRSIMNREGDDGRDSYELKRAYWAGEVERIKGLLTPESFIGDGGVATKAKYPMSIPMYRS